MLSVCSGTQYLACPPAVAATMPPEMQRLIGYTTYGDALGYFGNFQHPREAIEQAKAKL